jgi:hypothetical protein
MSSPGPLVVVSAGSAAARVPVSLGVPFPRGWITDPGELRASVAVTGDALAVQTRLLARWPDRSVKWLLVDVLAPAVPAPECGSFRLWRDGPDAPEAQSWVASPGTLSAERRGHAVVCGTGRSHLEFLEGAEILARMGGSPDAPESAGGATVRVVLTDAQGVVRFARADAAAIDTAGSVRVEVVQRGGFGPGCPLEFVARWSVMAGSSSAVLDLRIRNPQAAQHPGGLWDLGDAGSVSIADLSLEVEPGGPTETIEWRVSPGTQAQRTAPPDWSLYQDSSGGERWDSPNHLDADGRLGVTRRGYVVLDARDGAADPAHAGLRAQPSVCTIGAQGRVAVSVRDFWQNFPKALRYRDGRLSAGLFPRERRGSSELQGGEQKRHRIAIAWGADALRSVEAGTGSVHASIDPAWVESTGAVPGLVADLSSSPAWNDHVRTIVDGPESFIERRERIDEYGWRHFGDLWADHESVGDKSGQPFVSHYNNQYDFVFGAGLHAMRTGDPRWANLAREAADHTVDIDIYHTNADRAVFNGGLFWHTDHYRPARTATHRTYSRSNAQGADYGGGPSNEHDYASGLLLHYFRTGDGDAREAVIGLGDWVIAMDDGSRTLLGVIDPGPTGLASRTLDPDYHGPGRGAGNSIATLLDAFAVTRHRRYVDKAEELIRRCIHPADVIALRCLDQPEARWSYLVFLQVLGAYLALKQELDELDYSFHYARHSLLHYADWMLDNEVPYKDVFHKLELPTESWPAHDIRKCHVMHLAARYDDRGRSAAFRERAAFFHDRSLQDLDAFPTRHLTRPLVILAVFGHLHAYFERLGPMPASVVARWVHDHDFGEPGHFVTQRDRVGATLRQRVSIVRTELGRMMRDRIGRWRARRAAGIGMTGESR